jgi:hypothetical protein
VTLRTYQSIEDAKASASLSVEEAVSQIEALIARFDALWAEGRHQAARRAIFLAQDELSECCLELHVQGRMKPLAEKINARMLQWHVVPEGPGR